MPSSKKDPEVTSGGWRRLGVLRRVPAPPMHVHWSEHIGS